jgi:hypothetical protein
MTDSGNVLEIETNTGDTVKLKDDGDNIWLNNGNDYTNIADGTKVTVTGTGTTSIDRTTPTGNDDIIGFDGTAIDAGAGNDRIVVLDGTWNGGNIDFSKLDNIETLDLSKSGDHDLGSLTLADVTGMTDSNKHLTIEGDNNNDKVTFDTANGGWVQGADDGTYTTWTNTGDNTVQVKVDDDIAVTVI